MVDQEKLKLVELTLFSLRFMPMDNTDFMQRLVEAHCLVQEMLTGNKDVVRKDLFPPDLLLISREYRKAIKINPKTFASRHEGYAILLEKVDELWKDIKGDRPWWPDVEKEASHVGAMALKFIIDLKNSNAS